MTISPEIARSSAPVLITGETGTGKEVAARALHNSSRRSARAFVAINCAALPESLAESELFGHVRGAFTGADVARAGAFELARGGTLFLDEIGDAPLSIQAKLLRALSSGDVVPVGGTKPVAVDVRVISATNVDLAKAVTRGAFRADLLYRLDVLRVQLRPLREYARDEFEHIARVLLAAINEEHGTSLAITNWGPWQAYSWPGNVRELRNALTRAALTGEPPPRPGSSETPAAAGGLTGTLDEVVEKRIMAAMDKHANNITRASVELGLTRTALSERLRKLRSRAQMGDRC